MQKADAAKLGAVIKAGGKQHKVPVHHPLEIYLDADIDIRVDNGVIRNDRELYPKGRETNGRVAGRLGLGGKLIKLRTSNGSVSLH